MHRCRIRMNQSPRRDDSNGCLIVKMRGSHLRRKGMCPMRTAVCEGGISAEEQPQQTAPCGDQQWDQRYWDRNRSWWRCEMCYPVLNSTKSRVGDRDKHTIDSRFPILPAGKLGRETKKQSKTIIEDD